MHEVCLLQRSLLLHSLFPFSPFACLVQLEGLSLSSKLTKFVLKSRHEKQLLELYAKPALLAQQLVRLVSLPQLLVRVLGDDVFFLQEVLGGVVTLAIGLVKFKH